MTPSEILITQKEKKLIVSYTELINEVDSKTLTIENLNAQIFEFKKFHLIEERNLNFSSEDNMILMLFCLDGEFNYKHFSAKKSFNLKSNTYNIAYIPKGEFSLSSTTESANVLGIYVEDNFFFRQMPENHSSFRQRNTNSFGPIFTKNLSIDVKLTHILNEICNCEFEEHLKQLYLKAKIIELITLQLSQASQEKTAGLKPIDIERMMQVKSLIESNVSDTLSLAHLARLAGTNEQYLKKHFKILYGNTVFGYILACKMQKAKNMLLNENCRIAEVAESIGYTHATHFTSAFKKFFGYLPKALKTKVLIGSYFSINIDLELFLEMAIAI